MLQLRHKETVPPGGRWVWDPELPGIQPIQGGTLRHLLARVEMFRAGNGLDLSPGWQQRIEADICRQLKLDSAWCRHVDPEPKETNRTIGFQEVGRFLSVLTHWIADAVVNSQPWVSEEEADQRSKICAACPYNMPVDAPCTGCADLVGKATSLIGGRTTSQDDKLKSCAICGCDNRAQIHVALHVLANGVSQEMKFPDFCWKKDAFSLKS